MLPLSLEELVAELKQQGDTCALASMLFSVANLWKNSSYIHPQLQEDLQSVFEDERNYFRLWRKITPPLETRRGPVLRTLEIPDIAAYLSVNGYQVEYLPAGRDNLARQISQAPVIVLNFGFPEWLNFYGSGTLNNWYAVHVICALSLQNGYLTYFEPLAGEIRQKSLASLDSLYGKEMAVIRPCPGMSETITLSNELA